MQKVLDKAICMEYTKLSKGGVENHWQPITGACKRKEGT